MHDEGTFLNPDIALPFCPGCGQGKVVKELDRALAATGRDARSIVVVTDIGCTGLSDRHFVTNAFHGLHGRSITYATGIKLARPDLEVVVLMGDGGCGIGGAHLVNAARRNVGITVLVSNNFNFGMTGGQHSVTTPTAGLTTTTPWGNLERALDLCALTRAAGATFVARSTAFDADLRDLLSRGLAHEGFSFLDVWSVCSAYFGPRNRLAPSALREQGEAAGMSMGLLHEERAPELAASLHGLCATAPPAVTREVELRHTATLGGPVGVVVAGSAGQRVRSGAGLLGFGAIASGLFATQKDDYPITVRTGHSVADVLLSPEPIHSTAIESPDVIVLLSGDGHGQVRPRLEAMAPGSLVLAEEGLEIAAPAGVTVTTLPLRKEAARVGRASVTVLALGALLALRPVVPFEAFLEAAATLGDASRAEEARRAARAGRALAEGASG